MSFQNTIKKALYQQKPKARIVKANDDFHLYDAPIDLDGVKIMVLFYIPVDEAKGFSTQEDAQLLIRWLTTS